MLRALGDFNNSLYLSLSLSSTLSLSLFLCSQSMDDPIFVKAPKVLTSIKNSKHSRVERSINDEKGQQGERRMEKQKVKKERQRKHGMEEVDEDDCEKSTLLNRIPNFCSFDPQYPKYKVTS